MNRSTSIIFSGITLTLGGLIYICFRSENLIMFQWFQFMGISKAINILRNSLSILYLPRIIIYSLPDALWLYSLTVFIAMIWINERAYFFFWMIICAFLGLGHEIAQGLDILKGTFDYIDLFFLSASYSVAIIHSLLIIKSQNHENTKQSY